MAGCNGWPLIQRNFNSLIPGNGIIQKNFCHQVITCYVCIRGLLVESYRSVDPSVKLFWKKKQWEICAVCCSAFHSGFVLLIFLAIFLDQLNVRPLDQVQSAERTVWQTCVVSCFHNQLPNHWQHGLIGGGWKTSYSLSLEENTHEFPWGSAFFIMVKWDLVP